MTFKRHPHIKTGSRVRPSKLVHLSTVNPMEEDCIMLGGDCKCFDLKDCQHMKEVLRREEANERRKSSRK